MFESIVFMFLVFLGCISLAIGLFVLLIGLFRKSKKVNRGALFILFIPLLCFGIIYGYYRILIPSFNRNQEKEYVGRYYLSEIREDGKIVLTHSTPQYFLELHSDKTFTADIIPGLNLPRAGKWEGGHEDGAFMFTNDDIKIWATPFPNQLTFWAGMKDSKDFIFTKIDALSLER